jgi:CheY-like chemotaxis protein
MIDPSRSFNYHNSSGVIAPRTKKILVVDDEPVMLKLIEAILRNGGFEHLIFAHDGVGVLSLAIQERPQLIIMDVMMPKGNGLRALRRLKDNALTAAIPVILTSGFDVNTLGECAQEHASCLLSKPFTPEQILSHVEELLAA